MLCRSGRGRFMKIYGDSNSGNCLKVKWVCDHLALPYTWISVDTMKGESRTSAFLRLNGAGQVPVARGQARRQRPADLAVGERRVTQLGRRLGTQHVNHGSIMLAAAYVRRWKRRSPEASLVISYRVSCAR